MTEYTFIHLPPRKRINRTEEDIRFGGLLWLAKFKRGKYRFTRQDIKERWNIDLLDLSGANKLFLASLPVWYAHLVPILDETKHTHSLVDLIDSEISLGKNNYGELDEKIPYSENYLLSPINNNTPLSFEVIDFLKKYRGNARILVGGAQASFEDREFIEKGADIVVRGEGEKIFEEIVSGFPLDKIRGITYQKDGKIIRNPPQEIIPSLDEVPFYNWVNQPVQYNPSFYIRFFAQRGCPMNCCFCSDVLWTNKAVRRKSIARLKKELDSITKNAKFLEFHVSDNCLSSSKTFAKQFAEVISDYNLDWTAETRVDMVDRETLKSLAESGCVELEYGIESVNEHVLKLTDKRQDKKKIIRALELTKEAGINVHTNWMIGLPGETKESMLSNIEFACDMVRKGLIDTLNHVIMVPYPGTPLAKNPDKYGIRILTKDWKQYDEYGLPVFESATMTRQETLELYELANKRFAEVLAETHNSMLM